MAIEYLNTKKVAEILGTSPRQARKVMHEVGMVNVGKGVIRRDALDRYLAKRTESTYYTRPFLDQPIKPKYDRYARSRRKEA